MVELLGNGMFKLNGVLVMKVVILDASVTITEKLLQNIEELVSTLKDGDIFIYQK